MIVWITGQPGAGKTVIANRAGEALTRGGNSQKVAIIDGDGLRELMPNPGYDEAGRRQNIDRAQAIAAYLYTIVGYDTVFVSLVAPYRDQREKFKEDHDVVEVYVHTNETRGREEFHVDEYEPPKKDFIDIDTGDETEQQSASRVYRAVAAASSRTRMADPEQARRGRSRSGNDSRRIPGSIQSADRRRGPGDNPDQVRGRSGDTDNP